MAKTKTASKKRGKNQAEPGKLFDTTHPAHKPIVRLCRKLKATRAERMAFGKQESEHQEELLVLMHKHKLKKFDSDGVQAEIVVEKEKVKVKVQADEGA